MKIYTQTYSLKTPSEGRFWTTQHSDIAVGLKVADALSATLTLKDSAGSTLTPEDDKIDGFTIWKMKTQGAGSETYTLSLNSSDVKFKLVRIVTDSTVYDIDEAGAPLPADISCTTLSASSSINTNSLTASSVTAETLNSFYGVEVYNNVVHAGLGIDLDNIPFLQLGNKSFTAADLGPQTMTYSTVQLNSELTAFEASRNAVYNVDASVYSEINLPALNGAPWTVVAYVTWKNYEYSGAVSFEYVSAGKPQVGNYEASFSEYDEAAYMIAKWTGSVLVTMIIKQ